MRQVCGPAGIDTFHDRRIDTRQFHLVGADRSVSKAHQRQWYRRGELPSALVVHHARELARQLTLKPNTLGQSLGAKCAQDHPQLERTEAASQLDPVVHQVHHIVLGPSDEILREERERLAKRFGTLGVQHRAIDWREQPLMWIHHQ